MKVLSVILPIYNTVDYLDRCLDSICNQTYSNLEIICIDDGSTDGSQHILDKYAKNDNRIIAIHQKNGGESNARNVGLSLATGDYIAFCDCDDWLEPDMYQKLVHAIECNKVDLAACGYSFEYDNHREIPVNKKPVKDGMFSRTSLFEYVYKRDSYKAVTSWIWCKLFKREILVYNGKLLLFDENVRFGADLLFFIMAASNIESACYVQEPLYHYYQRSTSTSHTSNLDIAYDIVDVYIRMIKWCQAKNIETDIIPWLQRFTVYRASLVAEQAIEKKDSFMLNKCQKVMKRYKDVYIETNMEYPERLERYNRLMSTVL